LTHWAQKIAKRDRKEIDDWLNDPEDPGQTRHIIGTSGDCFRNSSNTLPRQPPVQSWHKDFKDPTLADATLDRIVRGAHTPPRTQAELHVKEHVPLDLN
jgi:hypothetical protein